MNQSNHYPICVKCQTAMTKKENGAVAIDMAGDPQEPYCLINCDIFECKHCGAEIVSGFAVKGVEKHESHFAASLNAAMTSGRTIAPNYEAGKVPAHAECDHRWAGWTPYSYRAGTVRGEDRICFLCGANEDRNRVELFGHDFWDVKTMKLVFPTLEDIGKYEAEQRAYEEAARAKLAKETFVKCPGCDKSYFVELVGDFTCITCLKWDCVFFNVDNRIVARWFSRVGDEKPVDQPTNFGIIE